jgi:aspartyl-tRNA(Asn)/glutamyl-tRNA(Gln) amidotransferase subunit A
LTNAYLERIGQEDRSIGAYLSVFKEQARKRAGELDTLPTDEKYKTPLWGIPFAAKDNICTKDRPTTCASRMLEGFVSPYSATVIERLERAGAILLGKTNMDEFGMGNTTEHSAFQRTVNPLCPQRVPGGSSGGSAAAVASFEAPFALGSDTGGSVRQPAAFCGLVGLKPTYGALSRYGLVAFASSLEQIGPLTRTVEDCALVFSHLAGKDERDATSRSFSYPPLCEETKKGVKGLRIGLPTAFFEEEMEKGVGDVLLEAAREFEKMGATVEPVTLPLPREALAAYYVISSAEASANLARYDGVRYGRRSDHGENIRELYALSRGEGFGAEVKKRILFGSYVLSEGQREACYLRARAVGERIRHAFLESFGRFDLLLCPTSPTLPPFIGEKREDSSFYNGDLFTVSANLAGIPAISLPCKTLLRGLPVGMQLLADKGREDLLFRAAGAYEREGTR